jgi:L-amino acid N-acyltransferase YncA
MITERQLEQYPKKIKLSDGDVITIRLMRADDVKSLHAFFLNVSESVRMLFKHRVVDLKVLRGWCKDIDPDRILPLLAWRGSKIIAYAALHQKLGGWKRHIGSLRLAMDMDHRRKEIALIMLGELVEIARHCGLEKLQAEIMGDHKLTRRSLAELGFNELLVLPDYAKDIHANTHDFVLMGRQLVTDEDYAYAGD